MIPRGKSLILLLGLFGVFGCAKEDPPPNNNVNLTGSVADQSGAPIAGAEVAVTLAGTKYATASDASGQYALQFPVTDLPQYFQAIASKPGFLPKSFPLIFSDGTVFTVNSSDEVRTTAVTPQQLVFSNGIDLIHLGDDPFGSAAASQYQTAPAGDTWTDSFTLTAPQKNQFSQLAISFEARGIECSSVTIRLLQSGTQTGPSPQSLPGTPNTGTFASVSRTLSLATLQPGDVTVQIQTASFTSQNTTTVTGGREGCVVGQKDDLEFLEVVGSLS